MYPPSKSRREAYIFLRPRLYEAKTALYPNPWPFNKEGKFVNYTKRNFCDGKYIDIECSYGLLLELLHSRPILSFLTSVFVSLLVGFDFKI